MKWKIDDSYRIETDQYSFTLIKLEKSKVESKTGKQNYSRGQWWYPTINGCLQQYIQQSIKCANDAKEILYALEVLEQKIEALELPTLREIKSEALSSKSNSEVPLMA
jgi:hypothetical protein